MTTIKLPFTLDFIQIGVFACLDDDMICVMELIEANKISVCMFHKDNENNDPDEYKANEYPHICYNIGKHAQHHKNVNVAINAICEDHVYFMLTFHN